MVRLRKSISQKEEVHYPFMAATMQPCCRWFEEEGMLLRFLWKRGVNHGRHGRHGKEENKRRAGREGLGRTREARMGTTKATKE
jgi:hypothetical protein